MSKEQSKLTQQPTPTEKKTAKQAAQPGFLAGNRNEKYSIINATGNDESEFAHVVLWKPGLSPEGKPISDPVTQKYSYLDWEFHLEVTEKGGMNKFQSLGMEIIKVHHLPEDWTEAPVTDLPEIQTMVLSKLGYL